MYQSLISSLADYIAQKAEKKAEEWLIDKLFHGQESGGETVLLRVRPWLRRSLR